MGERDLLLFGVLGGRGLSRYNTADLTGSGLDAVVGADGRLAALDLHGGFVGYTHYWSALWRSNLIFGQLTLERNAALATDAFRQSRYGVFNLIWSPAPSWTMGMELLYGRLEQQGGAPATRSGCRAACNTTSSNRRQRSYASVTVPTPGAAGSCQLPEIVMQKQRKSGWSEPPSSSRRQHDGLRRVPVAVQPGQDR